ncbi:MAG: zf-TFIIB domain-containing protein [Candidatus Aminicenantia bacterium]
MEKKICPVCQKFLEEIEITNKYGFKLKIDRCPSGCGFWFDQFEIYQIDLKGAEELAKDFPQGIPEKKVELLCPICRNKMVEVRPFYFSKDIKLDYCESCSGVWTGKEVLLKYKRQQEERVKAKMEISTATDSESDYSEDSPFFSENEGPIGPFVDSLVKFLKTRV